MGRGEQLAWQQVVTSTNMQNKALILAVWTREGQRAKVHDRAMCLALSCSAKQQGSPGTKAKLCHSLCYASMLRWDKLATRIGRKTLLRGSGVLRARSTEGKSKQDS